MRKETTESVAASSPTWETLEAFAGHRMQQFLQQVLEAEVDELLARGRYERRAAVDAPVGYRTGFGQPRRRSLSNGTITLRRPRGRGLSERFESRILPAFKRRTEQVGRLSPELDLHGLAQGDFDLALRGLLGDGAPRSAASIARLKAGWQAEYERWKTRPLEDLEVVYLGVDGVYVKAGLEKEKAAILGVLGAARRAQGRPGGGFSYLFEERAPDAVRPGERVVPMTGPYAPRGRVLVATDDAIALVDYLLSLRRDDPVAGPGQARGHGSAVGDGASPGGELRE